MTHLHHTGFTVSDLDRSVAFYRDLLGLSVVFEQEKVGGYLAAVTGYASAHVRMAQLELTPGGHRIELFEYLDRRGDGVVAEHGDVGGFHVCLVVEDLVALHARLASHGVDLLSGPVPIGRASCRERVYGLV